MPRLMSLAFFLLFLGASDLALAQAPSADAQESFARGALAYKEARYEDAIDAFTEAYRLDAKPALLYNIAQAYERLGDVPNALRAYRDFLRHGVAEQDRTLIETRIQNLEKRLRARGLQQVSVFSQPAGATVVIDDEKRGATPWTGELAPGRHVLVLEHPDHPSARKEFVLGPDRAIDLDVALGATNSSSSAAVRGATPRDSSAATAGENAPAADTKTERGKIQPWTWAALGVGAGGLGASLVFELGRKKAEDDARAEETQVGHRQEFDRMKDKQRNARLFLGLGAAASVAGGVLLFIDLRPQKSSHARLGVGCNHAACGVHAQGSF